MFLVLLGWFIWVASAGGFWWTHCVKTWLNSPTNCSRNWTYSALPSCCGCGWCGWSWRCGSSVSGRKGTAPAHSSTLSTIWPTLQFNPHDPPSKSNPKAEFCFDDIQIRRQINHVTGRREEDGGGDDTKLLLARRSVCNCVGQRWGLPSYRRGEMPPGCLGNPRPTWTNQRGRGGGGLT